LGGEGLLLLERGFYSPKRRRPMNKKEKNRDSTSSSSTVEVPTNLLKDHCNAYQPIQ
jgi:hypothetical protein